MSNNPGLFKDLGKRLSDLLTKEFPSEKQENKVEWKGTTQNNVNVETTFVQKKDGSWLGTFIPKYKYKEYGATVSAEITTKKECKAEVSIQDKLADGLKTILSVASKGDDQFGTLAAEYQREYGTFGVSADYGKAAGSTLKASGVLGSQGFTLGGSAEYFVGQESSLKEIHAILGYKTNLFDFGIFGRIKSEDDTEKNEVGANYFQQVNDDLAVGSEVVYDYAQLDAKPKLTLGAKYYVEKDTTLKAKFDTEGKLSATFAQKFNKNTGLTLSSTVDTNNFSTKGSSAFGFALSFEY